MRDDLKACVYTVGHSNLSLDEFLSLLREFGIRAVADVRRLPSSRAFTHFNRGTLAENLSSAGIEYRWFEDLGGRRPRSAKENPANRGLEDEGFRNYADYMATPQFQSAAESLMRLANEKPTTVMCAERQYRNCHRRLLGDYLTARGIDVEHVIESGRHERHEMSPESVVDSEGNVTYPARGGGEEGRLW